MRLDPSASEVSYWTRSKTIPFCPTVRINWMVPPGPIGRPLKQYPSPTGMSTYNSFIIWILNIEKCKRKFFKKKIRKTTGVFMPAQSNWPQRESKRGFVTFPSALMQ